MDQSHIFDITIEKRKGSGPKKLKFLSDRSPTSENFYTDYQWDFTTSGDFKKYYYIDSYRFGTGTGRKSGILNLSNYDITLSLTDKDYKDLDEMLMQVGDQSMKGATNDGRTFTFNLGKNKGVKNYLSSNKHYPENLSSRSFTFFEYPKEDSMQNYFGKNNIVVTVGPGAYTFPSEVSQGKVIPTSSLTTWESLQFDDFSIGGQQYNIKVGALADQLLRQPVRTAINLKFDEQLDASLVKATQAIIYQEVDNNRKNNSAGWNTLMLDWDQPIGVYGDSSKPGQALVDGTNQLAENVKNSPDSVAQFSQFFNSMLEISSTYSSKKRSKYKTTPSTSIQGMTFLNPPSRRYGTVTVNSPYVGHVRTSNWWDTSYPNSKKITTGDSAYKNRLSQALEYAISQSDNLPRNVPESVASQLFDNQIIGAWVGQSDAIEDGTANLTSGRNFYHVNDDSIKVLNKQQNFLQNTIHQGTAGSPISFGYGASGNTISDPKVDGLYIHRITQPQGTYNDPDGQRGLFLLDWPLINGKDYGPATFNEIYIPNVENTNRVKANALMSMGSFDVNEADSTIGDYNIGGFDINNSKSYIDIKYPLRVFLNGDPVGNKPVSSGSQNSIVYQNSFINEDVEVNVYGASCPDISGKC